MADDLIFIRLALILLKEFGSSGESDLRDVFHDFIRRHADTVINELQCLFIRVDDNADLIFVSFFGLVFANAFQLSQFRNGIAAVCNLLADKDVMIGIKPFLDNRQHIFAVNG